MNDISAIILTKNEEKNIERCIVSIKKLCSAIYVIDSESEDRTREISENLGASVLINKFIDYSTQFNWGLENIAIHTKWVLRIDADEVFTEQLIAEINTILSGPRVSNLGGIAIEADLYFLGKLIKYGGSKKRKIMLFRYRKGYIEKRHMDEHTIITEGNVYNAKNKFLHFDFKSINFYVNKLNWYATREMQDYYEIGYKNVSSDQLGDMSISKVRKFKSLYYRAPIFFRSFLLYLYFYYFRLGFLDGVEGKIYCYLYHRFYRFLVDVKIYESKKNGYKFIETGDLKSGQ